MLSPKHCGRFLSGVSSTALMCLSREQLGGSMTTPCWFPLCFSNCHWAFASFPVHTCAFVQSHVCVFLCVWSPSLPYHPWPLQRVITRSSSTDSKVSTPDSSNNADPPSSHPPLLPLLWRLYIDVNHNYIFVQDILLFLMVLPEKGPLVPALGNCDN